MDYNNFEDYIAAYLDGELSDEQKNKFEELMESSEECKTKFKQTTGLLNDLKSMPTLETSDNFLTKLHQRIELEQKSKANFIENAIQYFSFSNVKPVLSFAMSFGAIAIFTFIYLNDLNIFNQGIANNDNSKSILKHESIDIELASGIEEDDFSIEESFLTGDSDKDSLEENFKKSKTKFNLTKIIKDVIKEISETPTVTNENK